MVHRESKTEEIDQALESLTAQLKGARSHEKTRRRRWSVGRVVRTLGLGVMLLLLPFLLLAKVSVSLYLSSAMSPWACLGVSAMVTTIVLVLGTMLISYRICGRFVPTALSVRAIGALVGAYCIYSVLFISGANVKSDAVAETYRSLHPLLRLSVSTLVVADGDLVVTDAARAPEDYTAMGLSISEGSLHYVQQTGYVHAVDLRTIGRSSLRNSVVAVYFRLMGFRTLRHVGTADHLHVSLPVR